MDSVRQQYETFPYPPVSPFALPSRAQGRKLRYEYGDSLRGNKHASHAGKRILVAGAGTLEALVIAQQHPLAREVVAVDLSQQSINRLKQRLQYARVRDVLSLRFTRGQRLPPVRCVHADLMDWQDGEFDFILANNVIHHVADPLRLLKHLASMLTTDGLLRVVTYPKASRFWIQQTGAYLRLCGLTPDTPDLLSRARESIATLPEEHPLRSCFRGHSETSTTAGLVDAFFHACENPLAPLQWQAAMQKADLFFVAEKQSVYSNSDYLARLLPEAAQLNRWQRLEVMDRFFEVSTNPVFWFSRSPTADSEACAPFKLLDASHSMTQPGLLDQSVSPAIFLQQPDVEFAMPSLTYWQLAKHLRIAQSVLQTIDVDVHRMAQLFHDEFGVHMSAPPNSFPLPGLAMSEYDTETLLNTSEPWQAEQWRVLEAATQGQYSLYHDGERCQGDTLPEQVALLHLVAGSQQAVISGLQLRRAD